jgi:hypothetical protein
VLFYGLNEQSNKTLNKFSIFYRKNYNFFRDLNF